MSRLLIKYFKGSLKVYKGTISKYQPILWIERCHNRVCRAGLRQIVSIESSWTRICASQSLVLLEIFRLAYWALHRSVDACDTIFMAWLTLLVFILVISQGASIYYNAFLFSLNQFVRAWALNAIRVKGTIAILALFIALITLLYSGRLIKLAIVAFWAQLQIDLSHFDDLGQHFGSRRMIQRVISQSRRDTVSEYSLSPSFLIQAPIGYHINWNSCEGKIFELHDLERTSNDSPPSEFFHISCKSTLASFRFDTETESDFFKSKNICTDNGNGCCASREPFTIQITE